MPYRFIDEIATADVAFEARGGSLEEVFAAAAEALLEVMVADPENVQNRCRQDVVLTAESAEMLLFDFLQELVFLKDRDQTLLRVDQLMIKPDLGEYQAHALLRGEKLDYARHELIVDVKAVTLHQFSLIKLPAEWQARVVLDI